MEIKTSFGTFTNIRIKNIKRSYSNGTFTQKADIGWDKMIGATKYTLYKMTKSGEYELVGSTTKNSISVSMIRSASHYDTGLVRLEASNGSDNVEETFINCARQVKDAYGNYEEETVSLTPSLTIEGLKLKPYGKNAIKITWKKVVGAEKLYLRVHTAYTSSCHDIDYIYLKSNQTSYTLKNLKPGADYTVAVGASNNYIESAGFESYPSVQYKQPVAAAIVKGSSSKAGQARLSIHDNSGEGVQYLIYRSTKKNSGYKQVKTCKARKNKSITYTEKVLKKGRTYYYKVKTVVVTEKGKRARSAYSKVTAVKVKK